MALDRLADAGEPLAGPHRQGLGAAGRQVNAVPSQARQQPQRHPQQQPAPGSRRQPPLQGPQAQGGQQQRQGQRRLEQQQGRTGQPRQQPSRQGAAASGPHPQHRPPEGHHRHQLAAIEHGQPPAAGQGHQGEGDHGRGQGGPLVPRPQPPLHQPQQRHHGRGEQGRHQPHHPFRRQGCLGRLSQPAPEADGGTDQQVQARRFVEVGVAPEGGKQVLRPRRQARFQGHPGHDALIPVPQGQISQPHQGQHQGEQPDQQQGRTEPKRAQHRAGGMGGAGHQARTPGM